MPFETLPDFTQGGVARAEMGSQGIPLESFQAPPAGSPAPGPMPGSEDVIGREVDALTNRSMPTPSPQPAASAPPNPQPAPAAAPAPWPDAPRVPLNTSERSLEDRIRAVSNKYGGSFERLAEAHVHSEAGRTRAQQERNGEIAALRDQMSRLESAIREGRNAAPAMRPVNGQGYGAVPVAPGNGAALDFQNDPVGAITATVGAAVGPMIEEAVGRHTRAVVDTLAQVRQMDRAEAFRAQRAADLTRVRPLMDQIYSEDPDLYRGLHQEHAERLLFKAALDREQALRGQAFYREMNEALGVNGGTPGASPAPPQGGAIPGSGGAAARRPGTAPNGDWGNTPAMNRLWRSPSDSVTEMRNVVDALAERGQGDYIPIG